jgi:hypothetical protein
MKFQPRFGTESHFLSDPQVRICLALYQQVPQKQVMIVVLFDLPKNCEEGTAEGDSNRQGLQRPAQDGVSAISERDRAKKLCDARQRISRRL